MCRKRKLIHTSRNCRLERSASLICCALRDSVISIAELELNNVADRSSNDVRHVSVLRSSDYYWYNLVGTLHFRDHISADL